LLCVYPDSLLTFSHIYWKNIWEPRGDRIIMELQCNTNLIALTTYYVTQLVKFEKHNMITSYDDFRKS